MTHALTKSELVPTKYNLYLIVMEELWGVSLRESIPRLLNEGTTAMTACCAPACSQALPVKPQGVWARGIEAWARSDDLRNSRWRSSGPSSVMYCGHYQGSLRRPWPQKNGFFQRSEVAPGPPHSPVLIKILADKRPLHQLTVKKSFFH